QHTKSPQFRAAKFDVWLGWLRAVISAPQSRRESEPGRWGLQLALPNWGTPFGSICLEVVLLERQRSFMFCRPYPFCPRSVLMMERQCLPVNGKLQSQDSAASYPFCCLRRLCSLAVKRGQMRGSVLSQREILLRSRTLSTRHDSLTLAR